MNGRTNVTVGTSTDLQIPLDPCTSLELTARNAQVEIAWTDPVDKYATPEGETAQDPQPLVSVWDHTILVRKTGSQPAGPNDGTVVISSSVRNQYQSTPYVDTDLTNDTVYYYGVFAYNEDGVASPGAFTNATPVAGTPLSQLAEGTLIKIMENGNLVEYFLAKHSYEPRLNGAGRELCVRKDVYDLRPWDDDLNRWEYSDIRYWLNYEYKVLLNADICSLIGTTKFYYTDGNDDDSILTGSDAVFLLSVTELGRGSDDVDDVSGYNPPNVEGSTLPIAPTLQIAYQGGRTTTQWTRSPLWSSTFKVWYLFSDGSIDAYNCANSDGSRPCFTLPSTTLVDENMNVVVHHIE